jgi:hypothetical protein
MDLHLFARVIWRFKYVVLGGLLVAVVLGVMTVAKIDLSQGRPHLTPRTEPVYASAATALVTQSGFPWGSAVQQYATPNPGASPVPAGDLTRLTALTNLYVQLANSDAIRRLVATKAPRGSTITASQNYSVSPSFYSTALPILTITGTSTTRAGALATAQAGVDVLVGYLRDQQRAAGIADGQRVVLQELQSPRAVAVINGTKKTLPVVVIFTVMLAVIGLAFVLENVRPRAPIKIIAGAEVEPRLDSARRTA